MIKTHLNNHRIRLVHVVAFDNNRCIGSNNQLPWHIPEDLAHFKRLTLGGVVLMGRKTFESIGKPLPNRTSWVITSDDTWHYPTVKTAQTLQNGLIGAIDDVKKSYRPNELFVIGGGQIFSQTLKWADTLQISRIDLDSNGDVFYPHFDDQFIITDKQSLTSTKGIALSFECYQRLNHP